jgi:hypothetical protein
MNQTTSLFNPRRKQPLFAPLSLQNFFLYCLALLWSVGVWGQCNSPTIKVTGPDNTGNYTITQHDCRAGTVVLFSFFDGIYMTSTADNQGIAQVTRCFDQSGGDEPDNPLVKTTRKTGSGGTGDDIKFCDVEEADSCQIPYQQLLCNIEVGDGQSIYANFDLKHYVNIVDIPEWYFYVALTINKKVDCDDLSFEYDTKGFFYYDGHTNYTQPNGEFISDLNNKGKTNGTIRIDLSNYNPTNEQRNIYFKFTHAGKKDPFNSETATFRLIRGKCESVNKACPDPVLTAKINPSSHDPNSISVDKDLVCLPNQKGEELQYTIRVENEGSGTVKNVEVQVPINPTLFDYIENKTTCTKGANHTFNISEVKRVGNTINFCLKNIALKGKRDISTEEEETYAIINYVVRTKEVITSDKKVAVSADIYFVDSYSEDSNAKVACFGPETYKTERHAPIRTQPAITLFDTRCNRADCPPTSPFCDWLCKYAYGVLGILISLLLWLFSTLLRNGRRS